MMNVHARSQWRGLDRSTLLIEILPPAYHGPGEGAHRASMVSANQRLAVWLVRRDVNDSDEPGVVFGVAERSLQMLCIRLAKLVTASGCQLLLARAIHLAAVETPILRSVRAGLVPGMCLEGLRESGPGVTFEQMEAGLEAVMAQFIGLLDLFIGEGVTGRLVRDVWPDAPLSMSETDSAAEEARS